LEYIDDQFITGGFVVHMEPKTFRNDGKNHVGAIRFMVMWNQAGGKGIGKY
tara:strand:+ start:765 stop:917 length:153 start_codon:yes stop_codon:yes gene_type:complete